jgi:4-amino-4-deoxy-L-arabinose transferase-like glycosyltransferase
MMKRAPLIILILVGSFFFLNKPFHIDDTVVLHVSAMILRDPLRPFDGEFFWLSQPDPLFKVTTNPPLVSYWLTPFILLAGYHEWVLHAAMVPFLLLMGWGMYRLSLRFAGKEQANWAMWGLMLSPAVIPSMNVMRDVPMVGLLIAGVALWIDGIENKRWKMCALGALLGGMGVLAKYSGLLFLPLAGVYLLLRREWRMLPVLAIALIPLALWSLHNLLVYDKIHVLYLFEERRGGLDWQDKLYGGLIGIGACLPMGLFCLIDNAKRRWSFLLMATVFACVFMFFMFRFYEGEIYPQSMFWLIVGSTLILYCGFRISDFRLFSSSSRQDSFFLLFWFLLAFAYSVWGVPFQAVRHLILTLPPLLWLLVPAFQNRRLLQAGLMVQAILMVGVFAADYEYADVYRRYVDGTKNSFAGLNNWYAGHWGWMFYAEQVGWRQILPSGAGLRERDVITIPKNVHKGQLPAEWAQLYEKLSEQTYNGFVPLRTMNGFQGAAYYALIRGNAPYIFSTQQPLETFEVYRVRRQP